jgi:hypothetical protein
VTGARLLPSKTLPPKPVDSLPDSTEPHGLCPRCGRISNFSLIANTPVSYTNTVTEHGVADWDQQVSTLQCQGCHQNTVVVEDEYVGGVRRRDGGNSGTGQWRGIHWWPMPGMQPGHRDVPDAVGDAVAEGTRCLAAQSPRAAVVMFRAALQHIVTDLGSAEAQKKPNLAKQLQQMATDGVLHPALAQWADEIRLLGNAGAHPDPLAPVTTSAAQDLAELLAELLNFLYVTPARVGRARSARTGTP